MEMQVDFTADRFNLRGTLHLPEVPSPPVVIGCHGLLSDRSSPKQIALAEACNALGLAFFRFDHRGCGESAGRLEAVTSLEGRASDLLHAIRLLESRPGLGKRIGLFGSSMGGAVCLRVAGERQVAAVVTFAAPVRTESGSTPEEEGEISFTEEEISEAFPAEFEPTGESGIADEPGGDAGFPADFGSAPYPTAAANGRLSGEPPTSLGRVARSQTSSTRLSPTTTASAGTVNRSSLQPRKLRRPSSRPSG